MIFYATTRGVPQIYYGTEILMENSDQPGDHGTIRSDFPGGWKADTVNGFTGEGLTSEQKEAQSFTKKLLKWRQSATAVRTGILKHFAPEDGIYAYFRIDESQKVLVILNKNEEVTSLSLDRFAEALNGERQGKDVMTGAMISLNDSIDLKPMTGMILELQ